MHVLVVLYIVMHLPVAFMGSHCGGNVGTSDKVSMSAAIMMKNIYKIYNAYLKCSIYI